MKPGYLFPHRLDLAKPMVYSHGHEQLCRRLGFTFRLYDSRHTFGSRMAMAGVDLMTLRELMGHASITTTQRYCHPTPEHKRQAVEKLRKFNEAHASASREEKPTKPARFPRGVPTKVPTVVVMERRLSTSVGAVSD